ncbi:hypothetical protein GCM10009558_106990 [Virgisporangium aurantiacum]
MRPPSGRAGEHDLLGRFVLDRPDPVGDPPDHGGGKLVRRIAHISDHEWDIVADAPDVTANRTTRLSGSVVPGSVPWNRRPGRRDLERRLDGGRPGAEWSGGGVGPALAVTAADRGERVVAADVHAEDVRHPTLLHPPAGTFTLPVTVDRLRLVL